MIKLLSQQITWLLLTTLPFTVVAQKQTIWKKIDDRKDQYRDIALQIWDYAEVGYQEYKSSDLLASTLKKEGFRIEKGVASIPTAFVATYGSGKPVIGILGEFDALPGLAQEATPKQKPIEGKKSGHGCGHHLFGTASMAAAIAIKEWMSSEGIKGTLRFYGTPAEEGGSGKVYMVREGLFDDVDAVFHWHPSSSNNASTRISLANKTGKFRFYGKAAHASAAPEKGRSALDGVEAMNYMANMMREHIPSSSRMHYVITRGGEAPNVVPAFAEVYYYIRHPNRDKVQNMWNRLVNIAQGAAMGTDTRVDIEITGGVYEMLPNDVLAKVMDTNLRTVGGYQLSDQEIAFAEKIQSTLMDPAPLPSTSYIQKFEHRSTGSFGSTDVGDVSWTAPTAGLSTVTWVPGTPAHSWQAVAAGGMSIGIKGMIMASKTLSGSIFDVFSDPAILAKAKKEFATRRGTTYTYKPMIGTRKPALDYRN